MLATVQAGDDVIQGQPHSVLTFSLGNDSLLFLPHGIPRYEQWESDWDLLTRAGYE